MGGRLGPVLFVPTSLVTPKTEVNSVLGAIAQFERELMLERQREGVAKAEAEGKYKGRATTARANDGTPWRMTLGCYAS